MFIPSSNGKHDWQDFTLILPTVSVGNVGQLASDLIISTLSLERVGYFLHPSLLPVAGNNPYADDGSTSYKMTTGCEVFESSVKKIVVVQQRAPIIKGRRKEYSDWLSDWIQEKKFHQVVILSSTFSQNRLDHQITGSPFRILLSPKMEEQTGEYFRTELGWQKLEHRDSSLVPTGLQVETDNDRTESKHPYIPGSGITQLVFDNCETLPILVLLMFVSEGDNAYDALSVASQLNRWLNLVTPKNKDKEQDGNCLGSAGDWKVPMSWRLLFGSTYDQKLFQ
uniref:Proteasome assembly chaperone 2 n=1 Tax=Arion vulgaris TaxID=1028688 RepID=A0A0B6ZSN5_9EUPU